MRTTPTRFDELMDDIKPRTEQCYCDKHTPREPDFGPGRARFATAEWDAETALRSLNIPWLPQPVHMSNVTPTTEGATNKDGIWLRDTCPMPVKTAAHELGHWLLGHTALLGTSLAHLFAPVIEVEAETVAMLVSDALGLDASVEGARHYIHDWSGGELPSVPPEVRARVKRVATQILSAGARQPQAVAA